jgi:hypothetical protein
MKLYFTLFVLYRTNQDLEIADFLDNINCLESKNGFENN